MDGVEPPIPRRVCRLHLPRFIPRKPNLHSHAVRGLGVSLSLYQVTVLGVLHGICTRVAWLVENIKLSRIVCINGLCLARDYFVRTLRQFSTCSGRLLPGVFLPSPPHGLNAGARVLPGCCSQVGCRYRSTVSHTGLVDGFPGTSWSRLVKRKIPPSGLDA